MHVFFVILLAQRESFSCVPILLIFWNNLLKNPEQNIVGGFNQSIPLWIVGSGMDKNNVALMKKNNHVHWFKSLGIFNDYFPWASKSSQNIIFNKIHNNYVSNSLSWYYNPFRKIICCNYDPLMFLNARWVNLSNKV